MYKNKLRRIWYDARRAKTGLTDVLLTLYSPSGHTVLDGVTMTEKANGKYYHDYRPTQEGVYSGFMDSVTQIGRRIVEFEVTAKPTGGSVTRVFQKGAWELEEKEKLLKEVKEIALTLEFITGKLEKQDKGIKVLSESDEELKSGVSKLGETTFTLSTELNSIDDNLSKEIASTREDISTSIGEFENILNSSNKEITKGIRNTENNLVNKVQDSSRQILNLNKFLSELAHGVDEGRTGTGNDMSSLNNALTTDANIHAEYRKEAEERFKKLENNFIALSKLIVTTLPSDKLIQLNSE